jgi:hypothetical protein
MAHKQQTGKCRWFQIVLLCNFSQLMIELNRQSYMDIRIKQFGCGVHESPVDVVVARYFMYL